jgi:hypothetical protein
LQESSDDAAGIEIRELKPQMAVLETTVRAIRLQVLSPHRVNAVAFHAVENRATPFRLKTGVIPTVIVDPQSEKKCRDHQAVDNGSGGQIEHGDPGR